MLKNSTVGCNRHLIGLDIAEDNMNALYCPIRKISVEEFEKIMDQVCAKEWISVKDRLPNFEEEVILSDGYLWGIGEFVVTNKYNYYKDCHILSCEEIDIKECEFSILYSPWDMSEKCITHWMPLPEPPRIEDE